MTISVIVSIIVFLLIFFIIGGVLGYTFGVSRSTNKVEGYKKPKKNDADLTAMELTSILGPENAWRLGSQIQVTLK